MGSSSRASTSTASTTNQTSRNLNLQDTEGVTVGEAGGNVTVVQTDHNAFDRATSLAERAVEAGTDLGKDAQRLSLETSQLVTEQSRRTLETVNDLASGALSEYGNLTGKALSFGEQAFSAVDKALGQVSGAYQDAAQYNKAALTTVADQSESLIDRALNFVKDLQGKASDQLGSTVTALNTIAREQSKSTDERVAEVSQNAMRNVLIIVGIITVGGVAYAIFGRKS